MQILFPSVINQPLSQRVVVEVTADQDLTVAKAGDNQAYDLYLDDSPTPQASLTAVTGQKIRLEFNTPSQYAAKGAFQFLVNGERSFFVYCTVDDPTEFFDTDNYAGQTYVDPNLYDANGNLVTLDSSQNRLSFYDPEDSSTSVDVLLDPETVPDTYTGALPENYSYVLEGHGSNIFKIDLDGKTAFKKLNFGANCLGIARSIVPGGTKNDKCTWFTFTDGRVLCLAPDDSILFERSVAGYGTSIDASNDGTLIAITDSAANQLVIAEHLGGGTWSQRTVPFGSYPYDVFIDFYKNIWVTSKVGPIVNVFLYGETTPIQLEVGLGQKTIKQRSDRYISIVCTESNEIVTIEARSRVIRHRLPVVAPIDVTVFDKNLYIATATGSILKQTVIGSSFDGAITEWQPPQPFVYALDNDPNTKTLIAVKLYHNTPSMLAIPDRVSEIFAIDSPLKLYSNKKYRSDAVRIPDIAMPLEFYVPTGLGIESVVRNNGLVSTTNQVDRYGSVAFNFQPTGVNEEKIVFPVLLGNNVAYFESVYEEVVYTITPFIFQNAMLLSLSSPYNSNSVTISGLGEEQEVDFTINSTAPFTIVKNGEPVVGSTVKVVNGDTLAVTAQFDASDFDQFDLVVFSATCFGYTTNWQVKNVAHVAAPYVTKPYTEEKPLFHPNWDLGTFNEVSLFTAPDFKTAVKLTLDTTTDIDIFNPETNEHLIVDYHGMKLHAVDLQNESLAFSASFEANPYSAVRIGLYIAVTFPETHEIVVLDSSLAEVERITVSYKPHGAVLFNGGLCVAGGDSGMLYYYDITQGNITETDSVLVNGYLTDMTAWDQEDSVFVSDVDNSKVKRVVNGVLVNSFTVGGNPQKPFVDTSNSLVYVPNLFDSSVSVINLQDSSVATTNFDRPVHSIVKAGSNVYSVDMLTTSISKGMLATYPTDLEDQNLTHTLNQNTKITLSRNGQYLIADHTVSNFESVIEPRQYANSEAFIAQLEVELGVEVNSNLVTMGYMSRKQLLSIPEVWATASLIKNGQVYGNQVEVNTGDQVGIRITSPTYLNATQKIVLSGTNYENEFEFKTLFNLVPDYIQFVASYGALPGTWVESSIETISGISENEVLATVSVSAVGVLVFINGVQFNSSDETHIRPFKVKNGDTIQLKWEASLADGASKQIGLIAAYRNRQFASWNIYAIELAGAEIGLTYVNWSLLTHLFGDAIVSEYGHLIEVNAPIPVELLSKVLFGSSEAVFNSAVLPMHSPIVEPVLNFDYSMLYHNSGGASLQKYATIIHPTASLAAITLEYSGYYAETEPEVSVAKIFYQFLVHELGAQSKNFYKQTTPVYLADNSSSFGNAASAIFKTETLKTVGTQFLESFGSWMGWAFAGVGLVEHKFVDYANFDYVVQSEGNRTKISNFGYTVQLIGKRTEFSDFNYDVQRTGNRTEFSDFSYNYFQPSVSSLVDNAHYFYAASSSPYDSGTEAKYLVAEENVSALSFNVPEVFYNIGDLHVTLTVHDHIGVRTDFAQLDPMLFTDVALPYQPFSYDLSEYGGTYYHQSGSKLLGGFNQFDIGILPNLMTRTLAEVEGDTAVTDTITQYLSDLGYIQHVLSVPVFVLKDIFGVNRRPATFALVKQRSSYRPLVDLAHVKDQTDISAPNRGSFTESGLDDFIADNDLEIDSSLLNKYQLADGTWMYYYLNRLEYGPCVAGTYYVDYGLVKGG